MDAARLQVVMQLWCAAWACGEGVLALVPYAQRAARRLHTADRKSLIVLLASAVGGTLTAAVIRQGVAVRCAGAYTPAPAGFEVPIR